MTAEYSMQAKVAPDTTCNARTRNGALCQNVAGFKTDHYGSGRCYLHGGKSLRGAESPVFKHGAYSVYKDEVRGALAEKLLLLDSYDALDLTPEAQLLRGMLLAMLDKVGTGALSPAEVQLLSDLVDRIGRMVERIVKLRNDTAMTAAELKLIAARLADTVARYMPDDEDRQRAFLAELLSSMGMS